MHKMDQQGRIQVAKWLRELSDVKDVKDILLVLEEGMKYRVVPANNIPPNAKIFVPPQKFDDKGRLFVPMLFRERYDTSNILVYVQDSKLYIEFEALRKETKRKKK